MNDFLRNCPLTEAIQKLTHALFFFLPETYLDMMDNFQIIIEISQSSSKQTFDLRPEGTNEVFPPTDFIPETIFILSDYDRGS